MYVYIYQQRNCPTKPASYQLPATSLQVSLSNVARRPANRASSTCQVDQPIVPARPASTTSHSCPPDQPTLLAAAALE